MTSDISQRALEIAISQVGQTEKPLGSNWGHPVQDYLATVGIHFPASWCVAFLQWCYDHAASQLGVKSPLFRTGGVLALWNNSSQNRVLKSHEPQEGDLGVMDFGHGLGHIYIVKSLDKDGTTLHTIEGNSNNNGSRQGDSVVEHFRKTTDKLLKGYLRF